MTTETTTAEGVTTWMKGANGGRASSFEHEGMRITVTPPDEESTEAAFGYACELSRGFRANLESRAHIDQLKARIDRQNAEIAALKLRITPDPVRLLGTACVRFRDGELWLLNSAREGWSAFGIRCEGWDYLFRRYNVRVTKNDSDVWGEYWLVDNIDEAAVERIQRTTTERR